MVSLGVIAGLFFGGAFLIQKGVVGTILNSDTLSEGICHSSELKVEIGSPCGIESSTIHIASILIGVCRHINGNLSCFLDSMDYLYDNSSGSLTINTTFNHTIHAGYTFSTSITCFNGSSFRDEILLKPCLSGFNSTAYYNNTHVTISCEHTAFRFSTTGIRIVGDNDLEHCTWKNQTNECHGDAKALPNGVKFTSLYTQKMKEMNITCKFDGLSVDIVPQLQSTVNTTPSTTRAPSSSSSSQSQDNGQTKVTSFALMIFILCIVYFLQRDIFI
ncbi:uncharacterized protein LOC134270480 [Saccostrea cucullata]|uniref:uncharacterized protein LOC134270480 n=1 Tax=Saccostrea cuccullata TaxID=36930 RepID=UPI002ED07ACD